MFVALLFVTLPFTVRTVQPVLLDLDRDAEQAAASLGAAPSAVFRRIVLPQILPAMASGSALAFARALGEYGSLVYISSALPFKTEWAAQIIYGKLQDPTNVERSTQQAAAIAAVLLLASALVLDPAARHRTAGGPPWLTSPSLRRSTPRGRRPPAPDASGSPPWASGCARSPWSTSASSCCCRSACCPTGPSSPG